MAPKPPGICSCPTNALYKSPNLTVCLKKVDLKFLTQLDALATRWDPTSHKETSGIHPYLSVCKSEYPDTQVLPNGIYNRWIAGNNSRIFD